MPRPASRVPSYSHHTPSGQAYVRLRAPDGRRRTVYLGPHNSAASRQEYARVLADADGECGQPAARVRTGGVTVAEVLLAFMRHAQEYYRDADGRSTSELVTFRLVARVVRTLFADSPAAAFGPLALKTVRDQLVAAGLCRSEVNARVRRVKHIFKWASAEELVPGSVYHALQTVSGLKAGRTAARETPPVGPVVEADVEATLPHLLPEVAAMVRVQRLTAMRPGEVCRLTPGAVDRSGPVWLFRPARHKNAFRGQARVIPIGPKAQAVLSPLWPADPEAFVFSPAVAVAALNERRSAGRRTPLYPSHARRNAANRAAAPGRPPADHYTTAAYARAVSRACKKAGVPAWSPNRLRHAAATAIRDRFGLDGAQVTLGHATAHVTQLYAAKNLSLAVRVAAEMG